MERIDVNPVLVWIKNRIKANKNVIISINGATGSAKTYCAITLAYQISQMFDTNFSIKENMDFNFSGLLKKTMLPQNKKAGVPFIFEEVGSFSSGASARGWQSQANSFFFSFMQTTRHRQQILIFTCPHFSFLEKGARSLVHMQMETDGIDYSRRVAFLRCYRVQVNSRTGNFYFKYLRCNYKGRRFKFKRLEVAHPPEDMTKEYEKIKTRFTTDLNKSIIKKEEEQNKPKKKSKVDDDLLMILLKQKIKMQEIADKFGVHYETIKYHKRRLKRIGKLKD